MEILRKYIGLSLVLLSSISFAQTTTENGFKSIQEAVVKPSEINFITLTADSASLKIFEENIKSFTQLRGLAIQGEIAAPEVLWSSLAELQLLEYLFFFDNQLTELKIGGTSSTLKYLWIKNSPDLDVLTLNAFLSRSNLITSLKLDQTSTGQIPSALQNMPILKTLQISQSDIVFKELISALGKDNSLEKLILSDNNFQFMSKGLKKLTKLNYLDISGNNLTDEIPHIKHLINLDTLIANRNEFENLKAVAKQVQRTGVDFIAFDNQAETIKKEVDYQLPGVEIVWNSKPVFLPTIELPTFNSENKLIQRSKWVEKSKKSRINKTNSTANVKLLSDAFLTYDRLVFPEPLKNFDTLNYVGRYKDSSYVSVEKITIQNHTKEGEKYKLKYNRKYGGVKKQKKTIKIDHYEDSHVLLAFNEEKNSNSGLIVEMDFNQIDGNSRSELKAFQQYFWLVSMSKETFNEQFIHQKAWSDVRIEYDGEAFTIKLKGRFYDDEFTARLAYKRDPNLLKDIDKNSAKVYERYVKASEREETRFDKSLTKLTAKQIRPFEKELSTLWAIVEEKMSDEEKAMTHEEWLIYYEKVKLAEFSLLQDASFNLAYLARYMASQGFTEKRSNDFYVGQKWVNTILHYESDTLNIKEICIVNLDQKIVTKVDVKNNMILLEPFHELIIYGLTDQNQYFKLNKDQIDQLFNDGNTQVSEKDFIKKTSTTANFYSEHIFPLLNL